MALTVGQVVGLDGFSPQEIGEYGEDGAAFEHTYPTPDPFPASRQDDAEAEIAESQAFSAWQQIGGEPFKRYLTERGYSEGEIATLLSSSSAPTASIENALA